MSAYTYVGSRTARERGGRGEGITVYRRDPQRGTLEVVQVVGDVRNPSFFALDARRGRLHTVHGDGDGVSAYAIEAGGARLRFLHHQSSGGQNPVHLALSQDGRCLVVSNHAGPEGGSIAVMPLRADGGIDAPVQKISLSGAPGPHRIEQKSSRPHAAVFDPSGRFLAVMDKGHDRVSCFGYSNGLLRAADKPWLDMRQGAGPRLIAFHPSAPFAYVVNDLDSTVATCRFDAATGALVPLQVLSTLSDRFTGNSRAATVAVSPSGGHLYVSNRGEDSIVAFSIAPHTGLLRYMGATPSGGKTPRSFALDPAGQWLYALNEADDSICTFRVDPASGELAAVTTTECGSPICMAFSEAAPAA